MKVPKRKKFEVIDLEEIFVAIKEKYPDRVYSMWKSYPYPGTGDGWVWKHTDDAQVAFLPDHKAILYENQSGFQLVDVSPFSVNWNDLFGSGIRLIPSNILDFSI